MQPGIGRFTQLALALAFWSGNGLAQQAAPQLEEIRVLGNRLDYAVDNTPAPRLIYGREHFQSFEPQGVGDMLKRVAGVAFSSDIGELDAPQLRGLGARYTQVLINGQRVPGNAGDRTVLVDRIPAELIERIELVRSPTAAMDSQGIGGTLNLVLKDGASQQGTAWRLGGIWYPDPDHDVRGTASLASGKQGDAWSYLVAANLQQGLNPKTKRETVFTGEQNPARRLDAVDLRDSTDRALRGSFSRELQSLGTLDFRLGYLDSRIEEQERIDILDLATRPTESGREHRRTDQDRLEFALQFRGPLSDGGGLQLNFSGGRFAVDSRELEAVLNTGIEQLTLQQSGGADGQALQLTASVSRRLTAAHEIAAGAGVSHEERDADERLRELDEDELIDVTPGNGAYRVEETRVHAFLMDTWQVTDAVILEYGVRVEDTGLTQRGSGGNSRESQLELNPSGHLQYRLGDTGQLRASLARTLRRPAFDEIIPFTSRDTPDEDQETVGNPALQPESAWGVDIGYTRRLVDNPGQFGINFFYRSIDDRIELTRIDDDRFTPRNIGTGKAWGVELDFATSFSLPGLPRVGVFGNYVWTDSSIDDPFTGQTRQFNLQPGYITNLDLYHDIPALGLSHGISWQKQGDAREVLTDEVKSVRYGANLDYFIEKRFLADFTVRFTVNNILDANKREQSLLYEGLADLRDNVIDETVFETEHADTVFFLTLRGSF